MAGWHLSNARIIEARKAEMPNETRVAVEEALELLLENPFDPPGLFVHPMRGRHDEDVYIAHLPDDWYLTYVPRVMGTPPLVGHMVECRAFVHMVV